MAHRTVPGRGRGRAITGLPAPAVQEPRGTNAERVNPGFHRAILKIALELKKPSAQGYEAIVERTIRSMRLDPAAFRRYLGENGARNMNLLIAAARGAGI